MKKFLLTILIFICSVSGIYSAYLLFNHGIEPIVGAILISVCVVVFIWCLSLLKKHRLGGSNIFWVFIITILLLGTSVAYAGVEPMAGAKDKVSNWLDTQTSKIAAPKDSVTTPKTGLNLSSEYSNTYPAYEQDLGGGLKLYSKIPIPPPIKVWNYKVEWDTGVCYAVKVTKKVDGITVIGFWEVRGDKWVFHNSELFMNYKAFDNSIKVSNAPTYEIR